MDTHRTESYEDEIELMDYLLVIWKWKYLILVGTLVCAVVAVIISFTAPKKPETYRIVMVLEIMKERPKMVYFDAPENIKALIEEGVFNYQILNNIKSSDVKNTPTSLQFNLTIPEGTNILKISYETSNIKEGIKILKYLNEALFARHNPEIKRFQEEYERKIRFEKIRVSILENERQVVETNMKNIKKRLTDLEFEIKVLNDNTDLILKQIDMFKKNINKEPMFISYLRSHIIQESKTLKNQYKDQVLEYRHSSEKGKIDLKRIQVDKTTLLRKIIKLENEKKTIRPINILQPPTATKLLSQKMKITRNVILSSLLGLFFMVFIAFFLEYISKYKNREKRAER